MSAQADHDAPQATIETIASADASAKLERVCDSGRMERGAVVLIGLDQIKATLGARWARRKEQVAEHTERRIRTRLSETDMSSCVSETAYVLCFAEKEGIAAHAVAVRILEEVVVHFLGACATQNLVIQTVRSFAGGTIYAEPLDLASLGHLRSDRPEPGALAGLAGLEPPPREEADEPAASLVETTRLPAPAGEDAEAPPPTVASLINALNVEWDVEPVLNLKHRAAAALRIRPRLSDARTGAPIRWLTLVNWPTPALIELECGFIDMAGQVASKQRPSERRGLILPLSIHTLSTSRGRMQIVRRLTDMPAALQKRLVIEIGGVSSGTPPGHLQDAVGFLRPRARAIIVHPHLTKSTFAMLRYAQIDGLSACARDLGHDVREISGNMIAFAMAARDIVSMVMVTRISSHALTDCAEGAGITHVSVCGDLVSESAHLSQAVA